MGTGDILSSPAEGRDINNCPSLQPAAPESCRDIARPNLASFTPYLRTVWQLSRMRPPVFLVLGLAALVPSTVLAASGSGHSTRYWDCCKPSCAWSKKAAVSAPILTCDARDNPLSNPDVKSGCDGGTAFACTNNSPWAVNDNLAYGFAATAINGGSESSWCCACYAFVPPEVPVLMPGG